VTGTEKHLATTSIQLRRQGREEIPKLNQWEKRAIQSLGLLWKKGQTNRGVPGKLSCSVSEETPFRELTKEQAAF